MATLRVRKGVNSVVHLLDGTFVHLVEDKPFDDRDPVIRAVCEATGTKPDAWFQSDDTAPTPGRQRRSVEQATAAPGEVR